MKRFSCLASRYDSVFDELNRWAQDGRLWTKAGLEDAVIKAAVQRLRPKLMTMIAVACADGRRNDHLNEFTCSSWSRSSSS
jgi:hypothetical protein